MSDYNNNLERIVHDSLYVNSTLSDENKKSLKHIIKELNKSENYFGELRAALTSRTNETSIAYNKYINDILLEASKDNKLSILNDPTKFEDIIKIDEIYINIWNSLAIKEKINYLIDKKKLTDLDIKMINYSLSSSDNLKDDKILELLLSNEEVRKKIPAFSIYLNYTFSLLSKLSLNDFELCNILAKDSYTKILLKKCKSFNEFKDLYESNKKIYNLIANNGLTFKSEDNEQIYSFILEEPNFIGKFNNKYLDLFNIVEITNFSKIKTLDSDAYSSILKRLYKYDNDKSNELFSEDNLKKCSKHSLDISPFHNFSDDLRSNIFNNYILFNRFIDTVMIEAIDNYFEEEDIVNILRNDNFVDDMSSYAIELLLNKLSFRSAFNMLQRKGILNKVNNLNCQINTKDLIFVKGFLDSPSLVVKSDHSMIFDMLNMMNKDEVLYYITLPYICDAISNFEIINLCIQKEIDINTIVNSEVLVNVLNVTDLIALINESWQKKFDLSIFNNKSLIKMLFNIDDALIEDINICEVNYLFETIRMKSLLSKQDITPTVMIYKSVLASYMTLGLDDTLNLVSKGNSLVTLDEVLKLKNSIVDERILKFKENNSSVFHNMHKKVIESLLEIGYVEDINDFSKKLRKNTYLDNVIYLMLDNNYGTYNDIINKFYSFVNYYTYNEFNSNKEIYDYCNGFISKYIESKTIEYEKEFKDIILNNFKPKENVIYEKRKELGRDYISKVKLKLFIRALTETNKDTYKYFFRTGYDLDNIKSKYMEYLQDTEQEFENILEHILMPLSNDRFDKINCLNKIGISKPDNFEEYIKYNEDLKVITTLNYEIDTLKEMYNSENIISIMNYICYGSDLIFKVKTKERKKFDKLHSMINTLSGEIYIDKSATKFIYADIIDIYNIDEIIEYKNYLDILDKIIDKTFNYINRNMNNNNVKNYYSKQYFEAINTDDCIFPITNKYYEPKKRVFSLSDINTIFSGYEFNNYKKINDSLKQFLFNNKNLIMVADGYYKGLVNNLGVIISKWDEIIALANEINLDMNSLTLIKVESLLTIISFEDNILGKCLRKDIIKSICDDGYYEVLDLNERISILIDLFRESFKMVKSTIPYLIYKDDSYVVKTIDKYDQDSFVGLANSLYKVGSVGNDLLHYSLLSKNGTQIGIYKEDKIIAKSIGVRNGNTLYLNYLDSIAPENLVSLLKSFANEMIKITKDDNEPIEFVTIVNNDSFKDESGFELDATMCELVNNPIANKCDDYKLFKTYKNLIDEDIYSHYAEGVTTLLASSIMIDKNNFKYYDAEDKYLRKRNSVVKLSNNIGENYLNKIDTILCLCKEFNNDNVEDIHLNEMDTIYIGDDFVLFITNENSVFKYILPFDDRAIKEVNLILDSLGYKDV